MEREKKKFFYTKQECECRPDLRVMTRWRSVVEIRKQIRVFYTNKNTNVVPI